MLTIEELKNLQVGDWVWLTDGAGHLGSYVAKASAPYEEDDKTFNFDSLAFSHTYPYSTYGASWLAYKNKEEAEGKSITLPYLLCTSSKFACVIWRDKDGKVHKTYTMPIDEAKGVLKEKERVQNESHI